MIKLNKKSKIYILCPASIPTGGPESIHLLCEKLLENGLNAYIVYNHHSYPGGRGHPGHGVIDRSYVWDKYIGKEGKHPEYKKYNTQSIDHIEDNKNNLLISPEIFLNSLEKFNNIQKSIWWLASRIEDDGVYNPNKWFNSDENVYHFHNSYFAEYMLRSLPYFSDSNIYQLQTYVNSDFGNSNNKKNIISYNPKKGFEYTKQIIENCDRKIEFQPIENMERGEVIQTLQHSKVYIDFGHHPGRERMPREAALCGCCIITGFRGSSQFFKDVPIPSQYKFCINPISLRDIINTIQDCVYNYETNIENFKHYKRVLENNHLQFNIDVDNIFGSYV